MKQTFGIFALFSASILSLGLGDRYLQFAQAALPPISNEDANSQPVDLGVWEGVVDLNSGKTTLKQLSGDRQVLVAAVLGNGSRLTSVEIARLANNRTLVTTGAKTYASVSFRFWLVNQTGGTLGESTPGNTTGVRLQLMPYAGTTPAADGSFCERGATTLQRPICVVSTLIPGGTTGPSGRNDGTDPVYLAYMNPRDGSNLWVADDLAATELNEATGRTSLTDFARTAWLTNTRIPHNSSSTIGLRFRYQQTKPGNGQLRVTSFRFKFRILADRRLGTAPTATNSYVTSIAGNGTPGSPDGVGAAARFNSPFGVAIDPKGTKLYAVDRINHRIRSVNLATSQVTTLAGGSQGTSDGIGTAARFNFPTGAAVNSTGTKLYVADRFNHLIRVLDLATNQVTTIAGSTQGYNDGQGTTAQFNLPSNLAVHPDGKRLYAVDDGNHRIRQIDLNTKQVTTLAGSTQGSSNGIGTAAKFNFPAGAVVSPDGKKLYVADRGNHRIREINLETNEVSTLAGRTVGANDGVGLDAQFYLPASVAINPSGTTLYVADQENHRIRAIDLKTKQVTTITGTTKGFNDGLGTAAQFANPFGIAINPSGTILYVGDFSNQRLRQIQAIEGLAP
jgi:DNA-binding beta-propeller fold protein YncE